MKKHRLKDKLLDELREAPNISRACQRLQISRQTYYRWLQEDPKLVVQIEAATNQGYEAMRDYAESKLMANVESRNQRAIEYALQRYDNKLTKRPPHHDQYRGKTLADLIQAAGEERKRKLPTTTEP